MFECVVGGSVVINVVFADGVPTQVIFYSISDHIRAKYALII